MSNNGVDPSFSTANSGSFFSRKRLYGWMGSIFVFGLMLIGFLFFNTALRYFFAPWSLPLNGRPAMTGTWQAPVTLPNGVTGTLILTLRDTLDENRGSSRDRTGFTFNRGLNIDGEAHYCLAEIAGEFDVYGKADRQGDIADLRFRPLTADDVWLLFDISSTWQEDDTLTLNGTYSYDPTAVHIMRSDVPNPPITLTLHRATSEPLPSSCNPTS